MHINADEQQEFAFATLGGGNHIISTQNSCHQGAATIDICGDGEAQVRIRDGVAEVMLIGVAKFKVCSRKLQLLVVLAGSEETELELSGRGCLRAYGQGSIRASGDLDIELRESIHAEVAGSCRVFAFGYSEAIMLNGTYGEFRDWSKARVFDSGHACMFDNAHVLESGKETHIVYAKH